MNTRVLKNIFAVISFFVIFSLVIPLSSVTNAQTKPLSDFGNNLADKAKDKVTTAAADQAKCLAKEGLNKLADAAKDKLKDAAKDKAGEVVSDKIGGEVGDKLGGLIGGGGGGASLAVPVNDKALIESSDSIRNNIQSIDEAGGYGNGWFMKKEKDIRGGNGCTPFSELLNPQTYANIVSDFTPSGDSLTQLSAKQLLRQFSGDVLSWVKSGQFDGGPLFVTNYGDYLDFASRNASDVFFDDFDDYVYDELPSLFNRDVRILLEEQRVERDIPFAERVKCPIDDIDGFYSDFKGGLDVWNQIFTPGCNPITTYTYSSQELAARESFAQETARAQQGSDGIIPQQECAETSSSGACRRFVTLSPGAVIQAQLAGILNTDVQNFASIDEVNELSLAVLDQLFSTLGLGSTFFNDVRGGILDINDFLN